MNIDSIKGFLRYYANVRETTNQLVQIIPPDKVDWRYLPGKFSIGDLLRHIAAVERYLFIEMAMGRPSKYVGCGPELAETYDDIVRFMQATHEESMSLLSTLTDDDLGRLMISANGSKTPLSSFLRALVIHEVHHRGALCIYLNLLGLTTPPIFGVSEEQLVQFSEERAKNKL